MARVITNGNTATEITQIKVEVSDGTTWYDLCALDGVSRVQSLSWRFDRNNGRWVATAKIVNTRNYRDANLSLDPGHSSVYNPGGVPLLGAYHEVRISISKGGTSPSLMFHGFVGPDTTEGMEDYEENDIISVNFVGVMQPYFDYRVTKDMGRVYENVTLANLLNTILADYGFAQDIILQDDPAKTLTKYEVRNTTIGEALQRPVQAFGYCLEERYYAAADEFRPTVVDPKRDDATVDIDLAGNIRVIRTSYTEANVKSKVRVTYKTNDGKEAHAEATDATALSTYGIPDGKGGRLHRYMEIIEKEGSVINNRADAMSEADKALHDLSSPCPEAKIVVPWLVLGVEGGDYISVVTPTEAVYIGVTGIRHSITSPNDLLGSTVIEGTLNKRIGARKYWFIRGRTDWVGKHDRDRDDMTGLIPDPPSEVEAMGLWGENEDGSPSPVFHVRWHGTRDPRLEGYRVRHKEIKLVDSGSATSGTTTTLIDTSKAWVPEWYEGWYLILEGDRKATDQVRKIIYNTATSITVDEPYTTAPAAGESYMIMKPSGDWSYETTDRYWHAQVKGLKEGSYRIAQVASVPHGIER